MIKKLKIYLIAAIDGKRGLGKNNNLLFKIPNDLKRFKKLTLNHPVLMGRNTFESIGKPLPQRLNLIITRNRNYKATGALCFNSIKQCYNYLIQKNYKQVFIIGGGQIYRQTIKNADKLYLTQVKGDYKADTFFPEFKDFKKIIYKSKNMKYKNLHYQYIELARKN
jgi:dihydrofolate reductase